MKIAISGASGYIGQHLTLFFTEKGDEVVPLGKSCSNSNNQWITTDIVIFVEYL